MDSALRLVPTQATQHQIDEMTVIAEVMISTVNVLDVALIYATGVSAADDADVAETKQSVEIMRLQRLVDAYRLAAVNNGWNWRMVDAYGHAEYLRQRINEVDTTAEGTMRSGYDAAGYLRDGLAKQ